MKKKNKLWNFIKITFKTFVFIILVSFILVVCLQRFSNNKISIFNYRMFTVISGSMKPKYDIGDVLIAKWVEPSEIKVGDTISYSGTKGDFSGKVITHQVIKIEKNIKGEYIFHAKGLANLVEDPVVSADQIYGVVMYRSFILSTVYRIVATNIGFYLFIIIPLMYVIGSEIVTSMLRREEERREKSKESKKEE